MAPVEPIDVMRLGPLLGKAANEGFLPKDAEVGSSSLAALVELAAGGLTGADVTAAMKDGSPGSHAGTGRVEAGALQNSSE